jgi:hypothetical protein
MGYYIETDGVKNKAQYIIKNHGAKLVSRQEFLDADVNSNGLVAVVNNGFFEAAAFCYNDGERHAFTDPSDSRPKQYLIMERDVAKALTGYR